jgi:hypothetical protein
MRINFNSIHKAHQEVIHIEIALIYDNKIVFNGLESKIPIIDFTAVVNDTQADVLQNVLDQAFDPVIVVFTALKTQINSLGVNFTSFGLLEKAWCLFETREIYEINQKLLMFF